VNVRQRTDLVRSLCEPDRLIKEDVMDIKKNITALNRGEAA